MEQNAVSQYSEVVEEIRKILATNLKRLMKERKMTQEKLAECTDSAQAYISQVIRGERWPQPITLQKFGDALGVAPFEFFASNVVEKAEATILPTEELADAFGSVAKACAAAGLLTREDLESVLNSVTSRKRA